MRYFIELQYDGAMYCGWQRQPEVPTVQGTLEDVLSLLLQYPIMLVGAGRTDTGVNASFYVAHFDYIKEIEDVKLLVHRLNSTLQHDISVLAVRRVDDDAHARFDAIEREYTYFISPVKVPFRRGFVWLYYVPLDIDKMNEAAAMLLEYEDFTSFAKLNSNNKTNICHITHAHWEREADGTLRFTIRANRFLRNMVRAIVGTLVDVGRGRRTVDDFRHIIESRNLALSSAGAPAHGLFLSGIKYNEWGDERCAERKK